MPPEIRAALLLWLTSFVVLEAGLGTVAGRDGLRLLVVAVALVLVTRMAAGRNWARHALTVVFGLGVMPWLAAGAVWWLSGDASATVSRIIGTEPGGTNSLMVGMSVLAHVAAVAAAQVYMYRPASNRYFREMRRTAPVERAGEAVREPVKSTRIAIPAGPRRPVAELH